jgi:hypothetical protein
MQDGQSDKPTVALENSSTFFVTRMGWARCEAPTIADLRRWIWWAGKHAGHLVRHQTTRPR